MINSSSTGWLGWNLYLFTFTIQCRLVNAVKSKDVDRLCEMQTCQRAKLSDKSEQALTTSNRYELQNILTKLHYTATFHGSKEVGKGLEMKIKKEMGLK